MGKCIKCGNEAGYVLIIFKGEVTGKLEKTICNKCKEDIKCHSD